MHSLGGRLGLCSDECVLDVYRTQKYKLVMFAAESLKPLLFGITIKFELKKKNTCFV